MIKIVKLAILFTQSYCNCNAQCGTNLTSEQAILDNSSNRFVQTNGIPDNGSEGYQTNFPSGNSPNPNSVCQEHIYFDIPKVPVLQDQTSANFTVSELGPVGILVTGGILYNHLDGPIDSTDNVAVPVRGNDMDTCNGHPDQNCRYHQHKEPTLCIPLQTNCMMIGQLADGFPIQTQCTLNGDLLTSCWKKKSGTSGTTTTDQTQDQAGFDAGDCHLDRANGYKFPNADGMGSDYSGTDSSSQKQGQVMSQNQPWVMPGQQGEWAGIACQDNSCVDGDFSVLNIIKCQMECPTMMMMPPPEIIIALALVCCLCCCIGGLAIAQFCCRGKSENEDDDEDRKLQEQV